MSPYVTFNASQDALRDFAYLILPSGDILLSLSPKEIAAHSIRLGDSEHYIGTCEARDVNAAQREAKRQFVKAYGLRIPQFVTFA